MSISTFSAFIYGHTITDDNKYINFNEGSGEITAILPTKAYSLTEFVGACSNALNGAGTQEYTLTLDRLTQKITITAGSSFDLLITSGSNEPSSAYPLMGFTGADVSGTSLEGNTNSGTFYEPQNILQNFIDYQDNVDTIDASINESSSGVIEVVSYNTRQFMLCDIAPVTDIVLDEGHPMTNNQSAVSELRSFLSYAITKAPMEFVPDVTIGTFTKTLLESSKKSKKGVGFQITEHKKLFVWFEAKGLVFRELN